VAGVHLHFLCFQLVGKARNGSLVKGNPRMERKGNEKKEERVKGG